MESESPSATKAGLREQILRKRDALSPRAVRELSQQLWLRLSSVGLFRSAKRLLFYASCRSEVETQSIIQTCLDLGKQVALPRSDAQQKSLSFHAIQNLDELQAGAYGISEPPAKAETLVTPSSYQLILVPAVVLDAKGHRIGYGGGYYDRFLATQGAKLPSVALAFDFQVLDQIPQEAHDLPVNFIVTDKRFIRC